MLDTKQKLESLGGTIVELQANNTNFLAVGFREAGEVDLFDTEGNKIASALLDSTSESAKVTIKDRNHFSSPEIYHKHDGKMEYDLANDLGAYLASHY